MTIFTKRPSPAVAESVRMVAIVGLVLTLLAMIGMLAVDVRDRMSAFDRADSDNGQWVMMQTEVEVLRLQGALIKAQTGLARLEDARRWFNVLFSRVHMLEQSPLYESFIQQPENLERLNDLQAYIDRWVVTVDSSDAVLTAALPQMIEQSEDVLRQARALSLSSLLAFSAGTDRTRARVSDTLTQLALTTAATILVLITLAAMATRLYRVTRRQAKENTTVRERLQLIIATSPDAIVVTNRGGWTVEFNPAAEEMFGLQRDEVLGKQIVPLLFPQQHQDSYDSKLRHFVAKAAESGPQRFEMTGHRADGRSFPLEVALALRDLQRGALIVTFLRDISQRQADRLELEKALTRAQVGEKAKADFLAVMSHEMRTPLNGLIGSMDLMHDTALDEGQRELLRVMEVSGDILLGHVESVLDLSRTAAGQIRLSDTVFALDCLIEDCIANQAGLARTGGNTIRHLPLTGPLGTVRGDPTRLQQILLNLIGNAVKFTRNGTVTVETERMPNQPGNAAPQMIEIRVIDTGIGIAEADLDRVFDDFARVDSSYARKAGGTGLGLGIARRLVKAMGGSIGAESTLGEGSVFWLRLPFHAAEPDTEAPAGSDALPVPGQTPVLDVLVIEDNDINRFLLRRMLSDWNHRVTETTDGIEGVAAAEQTRFDVIITDISMPRLDGIETARRIRAGGASSGARIIALTAHALPEDLERFSLAGMDACLTKPVTRKDLLAQLFADADRAQAAQGVWDIEVLRVSTLQGLSDAVDTEVTLTLLDRMLVEGEAKIDQIVAVAAPNDEVARLAHQLIGTCSTFGAAALCAALADLEEAIRRNNPIGAAMQIERLPALWAATRSALMAYRGSAVT